MTYTQAPLEADNATRSAYDKIVVDIVNYVFHHEITSPRARQQAELAFLDALGCAIETLVTEPEAVRMIGPVVPQTVVPNGFKLPGTSFQLDPMKGAFDLGLLIRYLDHNDAIGGAEWGHPSDNLGAVLAVTDWLSRTQAAGLADNYGLPMNMKTLYTAMAKAYELQGIFQIKNAFNKVGLDHTILVKIASTAVTSWLMGLTEAEALAAVSQAWMDGHSLRVFRQAPNTGPRKGWAGGDACMRAVHLSLLSKAGQPGAPTVLTTPKWGFYATLFGNKEFELPIPFQSFIVENVFFKLIPAEGHGISAVEAAVQLVPLLAAKNVDPSKDIEKIKVRTHGAACRIINKSGELANAADRDHCMQYMVAVVLLKGQVIESADYKDKSPWATDPRVEELRRKIEMTEDEQLTRDYHEAKKSAASGLTVILKDGTTFDEVLVEYPLGHRYRSDTNAAVRVKTRKNLARMFDENRINQIVKAAENDNLPVKDFVDLLWRP